MPEPLYTAENCRFAHPLSWALTVFWRDDPPRDASWLGALQAALAPDGIRVFRHRFHAPGMSQFLVTALPENSPCRIVQRVKGRLQHLLRGERPKAFRRHFAIRSVGKMRRASVERYVSSQLAHHPLADARVAARFQEYQIEEAGVDLAQRRQTSHGVFWHVLHLVLVHRERWREIRADRMQAVTEMIRRVCRAKGWMLRAAGVLPDHVHLLLGCGFADAPREVTLSLLNNLAYAQGMEAVYQFGGYAGTVGEYDFGALAEETSLDPDKQDRGGEE